MLNNTPKTSATVECSHTTRVIEAVRLMSPENRRILADFAIGMVSTTPRIDVKGELADVRGLLDAMMNLRTETLCDSDTVQTLAAIAYSKVLIIQGGAA